MKKISFLSVLMALVMPAFAEENIAPVNDTAVAEDKTLSPEKYATQFEEPKFEQKSSNPEIRFPHGMQLGLGVSGLSGLNGFIGYNNKNFDSFWAKRFGIRFDLASMSPIKSKLNKRINNYIGDEGFDIGDLSVNNFAIDAKHFGALVDFYPFGNTWFLGGLRISGGYMFGNFDAKANIYSKKVNGVVEFELDGRKYQYDTGDMKGTAKLNWKYSGPYLGTGFDLGLFYGFKLYFDAGVVFTGEAAKIKLDVPKDNLKDITNGVPQNITGAVENRFEEAKTNATKEAQDKLDDYPYYPVVKLGFMYRF